MFRSGRGNLTIPPAVPGVVAIVVFSGLFVHLASICDDAYISFRYLDHWLDGNGLVYNPGERVEGYTNFLWIVALAPLRALGMSPETASLILSAVSCIALMVAVFRTAHRLTGAPSGGWTAVILTCGSLPVAYWAGSGMETVMFAALLAHANDRSVKTGRPDAWSAILFGLAALTRPTGVMFACVAFAAYLSRHPTPVRTRIRIFVLPAAVFFAFPLSHTLLRLRYYGLPLPNTYYAKVSGELPNLVPAGLEYLGGYLFSGGMILVICAGGFLLSAVSRTPAALALSAQVLVQAVYVAMVGGDYFPFHRFVVPIVPVLAVLAAVGVSAVARLVGRVPSLATSIVALALAALQLGIGIASRQARAAVSLEQTRADRENVARWLTATFASDSRLAINAAGLIPYRTGFYTIDMLGLNDRHIARADVPNTSSARSFVGHFKHDGAYVCEQRPDIALTSGATLQRGRSPQEAAAQAALNTFPGDREFLTAGGCVGRYRERVEEVVPGGYVVVYVRSPNQQPLGPQRAPTSAEDWFHEGVRLMRKARLEEAVAAFERSLELNPLNPAALTNLAFCFSDLQRHAAAVPLFEEALRLSPEGWDALYGLALAHENLGEHRLATELYRRYIEVAPETVWTERARDHLFDLSGERR